MVVGLGNCVFTIARALSDNGCDVIAVDLDNDIVDRLAPFVSHAAAGDSTDLETLQRIGVVGRTWPSFPEAMIFLQAYW